jgi:ParB/RepB/Spo0J family partition protein
MATAIALPGSVLDPSSPLPFPTKPHPTPRPTAAGEGGGLRTIPIGEIAASRFNPRQCFDDGELAKLADSLKVHGQLQPCLVRPVSRGFELVAGERRWRAAKLAKLGVLMCIVRPMSDALAVELAGIENYRRSDLNAIEEGRWFRSMLDTAGFTQQKLADRLGVTQGQVSNRLRLLDLPEPIQGRIISGEMPATWARPIAAHADRPAVMAALAAKLQLNPPRTENQVENALEQAVLECSRPLSGWYRQLGPGGAVQSGEVAFKPTKEQRRELDVFTIKRTWNQEQRCWNVELWDQLQAAGEARRAERQTKRASLTAGKASGGVSKADRACELAEQWRKRLYRWKISWLQGLIAKRVAAGVDDAVLWRLMLHLAVQDPRQRDRRDLERLLTNAGGQVKKRASWQDSDVIAATAGISGVKLRGVVGEAIQAWVVMPTDVAARHLTPANIERLASDLDIDVKRAWTLRRDYLELHTTAQLLDLTREWAMPADSLRGLKRGQLIDAILKRSPKACPKEILASGLSKGGL